MLIIDETERRTNKTSFLIAEVLEIISNNYPIRAKEWYYETYKRRGLIYGNGRFMRMNYNDSTDTGIETEKSVVCKLKNFNKGGKIPKNVKDVISRNNEFEYSFNAVTENESEVEKNAFMRYLYRKKTFVRVVFGALGCVTNLHETMNLIRYEYANRVILSYH